MTTTANKHGLRKAAQERTNRHAQRTPLPPKTGVVEEVREAIAETKPRGRSRKPSKPIAADFSEDQMLAAVVDAPAFGGKSLGKAKAFEARARQAGWSVALDIPKDADAVELTATRGAETIVQAWTGGVWDYAASFYGLGDRNTKPRNASGAAKLLDRPAEAASAEASKVAANRHFRKAEPRDITERLEEAQRRLPFDPELAPDEIIEAAMVGQAVVWYNSLSRGQESALVSRKGVRISVTAEGKRVVTFCCPVTGYRSCYVSSILRVGKGKSGITKGSATESAKVEVA